MRRKNLIVTGSTLFFILGLLSCEKDLDPVGPGMVESRYTIAFVSNRHWEYSHQLYLMDMDGTDPVRLTQDSLNYFHPRFSPDGQKIVFHSHTNYVDDEIYSIHADGSHHVNLTKTPGNDNYPQFSPDGSKIVFTSERDGNREIYIMHADGSQQQRLTHSEALDHAPQFSPDGSRILFCSIDDDWAYHVYTVDVDGDNLTHLTPASSYAHLPIFIESDSYNAYAYGPRYSPDGTQIAFVSYSFDEQNVDVYTMNSDGSQQTRLTNTPGFNFSPHFTPDGSQIVFMTHRGRNFDIYIMDPDGGNQRALYDSWSGHAVFSQYSPDGSKILFMDDCIDAQIYKIYIMDSDGKNPIQLTTGSFNDLFPQCMPNLQK